MTFSNSRTIPDWTWAFILFNKGGSLALAGADEKSRLTIYIGANAWMKSPIILYLGAALLLLIPAMVVLGPIDPGAESQHDKEHGLFRHFPQVEVQGSAPSDRPLAL
jgi:hypothetical protein